MTNRFSAVPPLSNLPVWQCACGWRSIDGCPSCRSGLGAPGLRFRSLGGGCARETAGRHVLPCSGFQLHTTDLSNLPVWQCACGWRSIDGSPSCRSGLGAPGLRFRSSGEGRARETAGGAARFAMFWVSAPHHREGTSEKWELFGHFTHFGRAWP